MSAPPSLHTLPCQEGGQKMRVRGNKEEKQEERILVTPIRIPEIYIFGESQAIGGI